MEAIIWLGVMIAFSVGEAVTVGLTSIWFAVGALGALITAGLGLGSVSYTHLSGSHFSIGQQFLRF